MGLLRLEAGSVHIVRSRAFLLLRLSVVSALAIAVGGWTAVRTPTIQRNEARLMADGRAGDCDLGSSELCKSSDGWRGLVTVLCEPGARAQDLARLCTDFLAMSPLSHRLLEGLVEACEVLCAVTRLCCYLSLLREGDLAPTSSRHASSARLSAAVRWGSASARSRDSPMS